MEAIVRNKLEGRRHMRQVCSQEHFKITESNEGMWPGRSRPTAETHGRLNASASMFSCPAM
eukprot:scaffold22738_cov187-Cylindrotheca_fusiformis.AAC.1